MRRALGYLHSLLKEDIQESESLIEIRFALKGDILSVANMGSVLSVTISSQYFCRHSGNSTRGHEQSACGRMMS